jgi:homoserine O-acetyltransferase
MVRTFHKLLFEMISGECKVSRTTISQFSYFGRLNKLVLDALGVQSISAVVGGSMGGFAALEWPLCTPKGYVRNIVPISTSVDHDAWGIAWAEAQRQCVFADPVFDEGNYIPTPAGQPATGLAAARMVAMLTYRSSPSFNSRFGRKAAPQKSNKSNGSLTNGTKTNEKKNPNSCANMTANTRRNSKMNGLLTPPEPQQKDDSPTFTAQSYLKYQGGKFINRFDANCFIHLTRKMDCHDVLHGRIEDHDLNAQSRPEILSKVFSNIPPKSLVIGIESDVLFRPEQQAEIASALPDAKLVMIPSAEGHDGFLLEFESLGPLIEGHLRERCAWIYEGGPLVMEESTKIVKDSVFGEVESGW